MFNRQEVAFGTVWGEKFDSDRCIFYLQDYTGKIKQISSDEYHYAISLNKEQEKQIKDKIDQLTKPTPMLSLLKVVDS